jgi:hypothetical protein
MITFINVVYYVFIEKRGKMRRKLKSQISFEYLIIMGFITFVIILVLAIALFYSGGVKDRIKITQMTDCANKIISTAESVFYSGYPSIATISCYLPEGIQDPIIIEGKELVFTLQTSTGKPTTSFASNVQLAGYIMATPGLKKIRLEANIHGELVDIKLG